MTRAYFKLGAADLGSRAAPPFEKLEDFQITPLRSVAYFCNRCGDIWGRIAVEPATYTQCLTRPCLAHGDGRFASQPCNSSGWATTNFADDWPAAAIRHEFFAELAIIDRTQGVQA